MASGISETKFIKGTNVPKRAGNFSALGVCRGVKIKDYLVLQNEARDGLIVGNKTPLRKLMGEAVEWLAINDPTFQQYTQESTHTYNGKKYLCSKILTRKRFYCLGKKAFVYRELINTECEFEYKFIEY